MLHCPVEDCAGVVGGGGVLHCPVEDCAGVGGSV